MSKETGITQKKHYLGPNPNDLLFKELAERLAKRRQYIQDTPIAPPPVPARPGTEPIYLRHTPRAVNSWTRLVEEIPNEGALSNFLEPISDIDKEFETIQKLADK